MRDVQMNDIPDEDTDRIQDDCEKSCKDVGLSENDPSEPQADSVKEENNENRPRKEFTVSDADKSGDNFGDKNPDGEEDSKDSKDSEEDPDNNSEG